MACVNAPTGSVSKAPHPPPSCIHTVDTWQRRKCARRRRRAWRCSCASRSRCVRALFNPLLEPLFEALCRPLYAAHDFIPTCACRVVDSSSHGSSLSRPLVAAACPRCPSPS
jgi:hypothetical protein